MGATQSRQTPQNVARCPTCSSQLGPAAKIAAHPGQSAANLMKDTKSKQEQAKKTIDAKDYAPPLMAKQRSLSSTPSGPSTAMTSSVISAPSTPSDASDYGLDDDDDEIDADNDVDVDVDMETSDQEPMDYEQDMSGPQLRSQSRKSAHQQTGKRSLPASQQEIRKDQKSGSSGRKRAGKDNDDVYTLDESVIDDDNEPEVDIDDILADNESPSSDSGSQNRVARPRTSRGRTRPERRARRRAAIIATSRLQASRRSSSGRNQRRRPSRNTSYARQ